MNTVETMIREAGGLEAVRVNYIRIENEPWMRLVVEVVSGPLRTGVWEVSVAHYGEQNGDPMRDPEMTFLVLPTAHRWAWLPLTWRNDYVGQEREAARYDESGILETVSVREERQQSAFATDWDANLCSQGFLDAFRRARKASPGAPMRTASNSPDTLLADS